MIHLPDHDIRSSLEQSLVGEPPTGLDLAEIIRRGEQGRTRRRRQLLACSAAGCATLLVGTVAASASIHPDSRGTDNHAPATQPGPDRQAPVHTVQRQLTGVGGEFHEHRRAPVHTVQSQLTGRGFGEHR